MIIILVSKCSMDIEQYVEFKMSGLISPSKSLISLRWVTYSCCRERVWSRRRVQNYGLLACEFEPS